MKITTSSRTYQSSYLEGLSREEIEQEIADFAEGEELVLEPEPNGDWDHLITGEPYAVVEADALGLGIGYSSGELLPFYKDEREDESITSEDFSLLSRANKYADSEDLAHDVIGLLNRKLP